MLDFFMTAARFRFLLNPVILNGYCSSRKKMDLKEYLY